MTQTKRVVTIPADVSDTERKTAAQLLENSKVVHLPDKDPDEELDYLLDWTARIDSGDYIVDSEFIYDPGVANTRLVVQYGFFDEHMTGLWLRGGKEGTTYTLTNRITTYLQRIMDQTVSVKISSR